MSQWPEYVEYAFNAIRVIGIQEYIRKDMKAFAQRWGGLDLATFATVLDQAQGEDQMVAAFALGHTHSLWARELLLPFLHDDNPELRWACALMLGEMREEQALPVLTQMLQEFLRPSYTDLSKGNAGWFVVKHIQLATILGNWGLPTLIPVLRETLLHVWQVEQEAPSHIDLQLWWYYQDELAYALGQLGAFHALTDLEIPAPHLRIWTVNLAMGYLNTQACYRTLVIHLVQEMYMGKHQELYGLVLQVLQQKIGLSLQEADSYLQGYDQDFYFQRGGLEPEAIQITSTQ